MPATETKQITEALLRRTHELLEGVEFNAPITFDRAEELRILKADIDRHLTDAEPIALVPEEAPNVLTPAEARILTTSPISDLSDQELDRRINLEALLRHWASTEEASS